ncbi:MAG: PorV/PorQ family protein [bacterium]
MKRIRLQIADFLQSLCLCAFVPLCLCAFSKVAFGVDYTATSPLQFLKIKPCRVSSLGGAFVGVNEPSFENPASFQGAKVKEIGLSYNSYLAGIDISSLSYIHPTEEMGCFGFGFLYLKTPDILKTKDGGIEDGKFSCSDISASIGYGRNISPDIAIGGTFKFIREGIDDKAVNTGAADLGIQYRPFLKDITIGLCLSNIGKSIEYTNEKEDLPLTMKGGISVNCLDKTLLSTIELDKSIDSDVILRLGFENVLMNKVFLRAGYSTEPDIGSGISFGFGLKLSKYFFDMSCLPFQDLGNTMQGSFYIKFLEEE